MKPELTQRLKNALSRSAPAVRKRGQNIRKFADKNGMVYFGSIDRKKDEIEIIRGITASTTHKDNHFVVGSHDGYDVQIVDRFDVFTADNKPQVTNWLIVQVDLAQNVSIPHIFLYPTGMYNPAFTHLHKFFNGMQPINSLLYDQHTPEFHSRYQLYVAPSQALYAEKLFNKSVTQSVAVHFWPNAIEVKDGKVYLYSTDNEISQDKLGSLLRLATWLSGQLDSVEV